MTLANQRGWLVGVLLLTAAFVVLGCSQTENKGGDTQSKAKTDTPRKTDKDDDYEHDWWCGEHGIPEDECGKCNKELRDKAKAGGDWCEMHKRIKSQCFACDPTLYDKVFEPKYMARYDGKKPKRPPEKEFK